MVCGQPERLPKDQMTPKERLDAFYSGKPYDRVPSNLGVANQAAKLIGVKPVECFFSPEKAVAAQVAALKEFEIQALNAAPGLTGMAEAMGCTVGYPDDNAPHIETVAIKAKADIDRIAIPDPTKAGRLPIVLETARRLKDTLGKTLPLSVGFTGPFTVAAQVRGTEQFMRDLYQDPDFAHRILRLSLDANLAFLKEAAKIGDVDFSIGDPTCSGSLISHKTFEAFSAPYLKELVAAIKATGARAPQIHICGSTNKIWGAVADTGVGAFSIDDKMDLAEAKKVMGHRLALVGNVKPTQTMWLGTPADVEAEVRECLKKAWDSPKGYILALGCGMPNEAPAANIKALLKAARRYGQQPYNPSLFN